YRTESFTAISACTRASTSTPTAGRSQPTNGSGGNTSGSRRRQIASTCSASWRRRYTNAAALPTTSSPPPPPSTPNPPLLNTSEPNNRFGDCELALLHLARSRDVSVSIARRETSAHRSLGDDESAVP